MDSKDIYAVQKTILEAIEKLDTHLKTISLLKLAKEFYTEEERVQLYVEYKKLCDADAESFKRMDEARPKDSLSWEARVEQFGEILAKEQIAPWMAMQENRKEANQLLSKFKHEHRLLVKILDLKKIVEKYKYEEGGS